MRQLLIAALLLVWCVAPARADMTLVLQEVGNDVAMHLRGSIDTSVFDGFPGNATSSGTGSFTHSPFQISTDGGSMGTARRTSVSSGAVGGDVSRFLNDAALTTVGTPPPLKPGSTDLIPRRRSSLGSRT